MSAKCQKRTFRYLFDYSVGGYEQTGRHGQAKLFRGFYVDSRFVFGRLFFRYASTFFADLPTARTAPARA